MFNQSGLVMQLATTESTKKVEKAIYAGNFIKARKILKRADRDADIFNRGLVLALCGILKEADSCLTQVITKLKSELLTAHPDSRARALTNAIVVKTRMLHFTAALDLIKEY
jgi:hypothetical protein